MPLLEHASDQAKPAGGGKSVRRFFGFRRRGLLGGFLLAPCGLAAILSEPSISEDGWLRLFLNATGWILFLLSVGIRVWATLFVGGHKDKELQTGGPYSICRNPLYLGSFLFALSLSCFLESATFAVALLSVFVIYSASVVPAEELSLEKRFEEDYRSYCLRAPRFWPRLSAFHSAPLVTVDLKRLKKEVIRLSRAALLVVALQSVLQPRWASWWPHWFNLP